MLDIIARKRLKVGTTWNYVPLWCAIGLCNNHTHSHSFPGCLKIHPKIFSSKSIDATDLLDFLATNEHIDWKGKEERICLERSARALIIRECGGVCSAAEQEEESELINDQHLSCGPYIDSTLEFHHCAVVERYVGRLRMAKDVALREESLNATRAEAKRCVLLCRRHHRAKHIAN